MNEEQTYTIYAILHELNGRRFRSRLEHIPEEKHFLMTMATAIVGNEIAKRIEETPDAVASDSNAFVSKLLQLADPEQTEELAIVLGTVLVDTLEDEIRYCCANCKKFSQCTNIVNLKVGKLFKQRVLGDESRELIEEIRSRIDIALENAPYYDSNDAHEQCPEFVHQYDPVSLGDVFNRYRNIASDLAERFGLDYGSFQQKLIDINMEFVKKAGKP
ncbi:MAG: hypothetical protein JSV21_04735 [Nitrospirota bacterium]|nr:MAG: hypothetical protein JSV21_04735 [Nitrospirota bacterium]